MAVNSITSDTQTKQISKIKWGLIIILLAFTSLILFAPLPLPSLKPVDRLIHIDANSFQFTPGVIRINPGDRVTIELVSTDVVHGISIDGHDFNLTSDPGQPVSGTFVASRQGMYRFRCSVACGNLHPFMIGKFQVGPNSLFIRGIVLGFFAVIAAVYSTKMQSSLKNNHTQVEE